MLYQLQIHSRFDTSHGAMEIEFCAKMLVTKAAQARIVLYGKENISASLIIEVNRSLNTYELIMDVADKLRRARKVNDPAFASEIGGRILRCATFASNEYEIQFNSPSMESTRILYVPTDIGEISAKLMRMPTQTFELRYESIDGSIYHRDLMRAPVDWKTSIDRFMTDVWNSSNVGQHEDFVAHQANMNMLTVYL